jgi:carboxypeptidase C (cathepsin A)
VTPGHLTIRNADGEPTASMFYVAYTFLGRAAAAGHLPVQRRPGSSTMWLHMGSFGPIKVDASNPDTIAGPPFRYGANPDTLLDVSDLVVYRRADHRPVAAARQGRARRTSSGSIRISMPSPAPSSAI